MQSDKHSLRHRTGNQMSIFRLQTVGRHISPVPKILTSASYDLLLKFLSANKIDSCPGDVIRALQLCFGIGALLVTYVEPRVLSQLREMPSKSSTYPTFSGPSSKKALWGSTGVSYIFFLCDFCNWFVYRIASSSRCKVRLFHLFAGVICG